METHAWLFSEMHSWIVCKRLHTDRSALFLYRCVVWFIQEDEWDVWMYCNPRVLDTDTKPSVTPDGQPLIKEIIWQQIFAEMNTFINLQIPADPPQKHSLSGNDSRRQSWHTCKSMTTCTAHDLCCVMFNLNESSCFRFLARTRQLSTDWRTFLKLDYAASADWNMHYV